MNKVDVIVSRDSKVTEKFMNPETLKEALEQQEALIENLTICIKSLKNKIDSYPE